MLKNKDSTFREKSMPGNEEVLAAIAALKEQVQRIADALEKQNDRKSYQAQYYRKRKAEKAKAVALLQRLPNADRHCLTGNRDERLPIDKWTQQLRAFAARGLSAYNFITWVAWSWNRDTYVHSPITKSGGYMRVFIGMSGDAPLRSKYSDRDLLGRLRVFKFTKMEQLDTFGGALWWNWTFRILYQIYEGCEHEAWFKALGEGWHKPLKVAAGTYGCYEIKPDVVFDPLERDIETLNKRYSKVRPTLDMTWNAFLRGLFSKEEPFKPKP